MDVSERPIIEVIENDEDTFPEYLEDVPEHNLSVLNAALSYVDRGWTVLPLHAITARGDCSCGRFDCASPGKHPVGATFRLISSRRDEHDWFHTDVELGNVAIHTQTSGLVVVDVEPRNGGEFDNVLNKLGYESGVLNTLWHTTGSGGTHHFFAYDYAHTDHGIEGKLGIGLDVKRGNGYVVAPPSNHTGGSYSVLFDRPVVTLSDE